MYQYLIFVLLLASIDSQSSRISVTHYQLQRNMEFSPKDRTRSISIILTSQCSSLTECINTCMDMLPMCRLFEYDIITLDCRLFEDDMTTGKIIPSTSSSNLLLGMIQFKSEFFTKYNQSCSQCSENRFLKCINGVCQCSSNSYYDGNICKLKQFTGGECSITSNCRTDYNLTCLRFFQCGTVAVYNGETVAGFGNGVAGSNSSGLRTPAGIHVTPNENLYVTDNENNRVQLFVNGSRLGKTVAGIGVNGSTMAHLNFPITIDVDPSNYDIYVADNGNQRIQLWSVNATVGRTVVGGSPTILGKPAGIQLDSQRNLYVSENTPQNRVLRWPSNSTSGVFGTLIAGNGVAGSTAQQLDSPRHMSIDANNQYIYIADNGNHRIQRWSLKNLSSVGVTVAGGNGIGSGPTQLNYPRSVCISKKTGALYIADTYNHRVQRWSVNATQGVTIGGNPGGTSGSTADTLYWPAGVALNVDETYLFVADQKNHRVQRFRLL